MYFLFLNEGIAHGNCYLWQGSLVYSHLFSNLFIGLSYYSIPLMLVHSARRMKSIKYINDYNILSWFAAFIILCGTGHFVDTWNIWHNAYILSAVVHSATAFVSVYTALLLHVLIPKFLVVISNRVSGEQKLEELNLSLEDQIKERTAELELEKRGYKILTETMPQIVWSADAEGNTDFFNSQWYDFTKQGLKESLGWGWCPVIHPLDIEETTKKWTESIRTGCPYEVEYRFKNPDDGSYRWYLGRALPLKDDSGKVIRWIGTCTDIDDKKSDEEKLKILVHLATTDLEKKSKELLKSNDELHQFVYVASHDLQEPIRMINNYIQLLEKNLKDKLDDKSRKYISFISGGAKRMRILIDDILQYSRASRKEYPFQLTNLNVVVADIIMILSSIIEEAGAIVKVGDLPTINANSSQIEQVFTNLISNAIKFRLDRPPIIEIVCEDQSTHYLFKVRDNGIGIDEKFHKVIFDIFQRLHTREEYPGTGIGLSIVKKIVERHGGEIQVESSIGVGTTFFFTIAKNLVPVIEDTKGDLDVFS